MPAVAVWTPEDGLLGALAPLGLAAASRPCLMVDLDPFGPRYPGSKSLADIVRDGPRREDLSPSRRGIAVLRNGGITAAAAAEVVEALIEGWDRVVLRLPARGSVPPGVPVVPVRLILPGDLYPPQRGPAVYQATPGGLRAPGPGMRLPIPSRATVSALVRGTLPPPSCRWIRAWRRVWGLPWAR